MLKKKEYELKFDFDCMSVYVLLCLCLTMSVFHYYPSPADYVTVLLYSVSVRFYNNDQKQVGCLLNHSGTLSSDSTLGPG